MKRSTHQVARHYVGKHCSTSTLLLGVKELSF